MTVQNGRISCSLLLLAVSCFLLSLASVAPMPAPYPSAPVWPDQQLSFCNPPYPPPQSQYSRKADMQHQQHQQQQQQQQVQQPSPRQQYDSSRSSPRHSPQHHRSSHQSPYSSQPNFSFLHASPSTTASSNSSPTHGRHHHAPSHPHITLQDLSYFSSQHPAAPSQQQRAAESQQAPSATLPLPPPAHYRGGVKSYSADITPYSGNHPHINSPAVNGSQYSQQSPHAFPPSPTSSVRVHSPRNNNVVHLSAAALEFSPTLSSRPTSAQLAAVSGSPPSPHSGRSTSSSSSSASSASSSAAVGQHRLSRASSNVSSGSPLAMTLQRNVSASSIVSTAMGSSSTSISHASLTSSTSSIASSSSPSCTHASSLAFPLHPCADYDTTWHLSVEQPTHLSYLLSFRTSVCPNFASPSSAMPCPHNASTCFASHSRLPRRRRPTLLNGRFNYLPTRCRYLPSSSSSDDADTLCPQGVHCRFAHCTEEVIYHPSKYKTQLCPHRLDEEGKCGGYGMHCAKAHGQGDLRVGVYEVGEDGGGGAGGWREEDRVQFVCAEWEQDEERRYYEFAYKVCTLNNTSARDAVCPTFVELLTYVLVVCRGLLCVCIRPSVVRASRTTASVTASTGIVKKNVVDLLPSSTLPSPAPTSNRPHTPSGAIQRSTAVACTVPKCTRTASGDHSAARRGRASTRTRCWS